MNKKRLVRRPKKMQGGSSMGVGGFYPTQNSFSNSLLTTPQFNSSSAFSIPRQQFSPTAGSKKITAPNLSLNPKSQTFGGMGTQPQPWMGMGGQESKPKPNGAGGGGGVGAGAAAGITSGLLSSGAAAGLTNAIIGPEKVSSDSYGVSRPDIEHMKKSSTAGGAIQGASMGAQMGSMFGPWGTLIGTAAGGVGGGIYGKYTGDEKARKAERTYMNQNQVAKANIGRQKDAALYASLAKGGMKLKVQALFDTFSKKGKIVPVFRSGGVMAANIIPKGKLHRENNDIDGKDKGIPVVDPDGTKLFEIEKEEFILNLDSTKVLENLVGKYTNASDDAILVDLGKMMYAELLGNTQDNTQKFVENEA